MGLTDRYITCMCLFVGRVSQVVFMIITANIIIYMFPTFHSSLAVLKCILNTTVYGPNYTPSHLLPSLFPCERLKTSLLFDMISFLNSHNWVRTCVICLSEPVFLPLTQWLQFFLCYWKLQHPFKDGEYSTVHVYTTLLQYTPVYFTIHPPVPHLD